MRAATALLLVAGLVLSAVPASATGPAKLAEFDAAQLPPELLVATQDDLRDDVRRLVTDVQSFELRFAEDETAGAERAVADVRSDIEAGRITPHLPEDAGIAASMVRVWRAEAGERVVFLPYAGSVTKPSGMTVLLDADGDVVQTLEAVYQARDADSGTVAVWVDGSLQRHVLVDAFGNISELEEQIATEQPNPDDHGGSWWHEFTWCLTDLMGVPSWVLGAISAACAVVCAFTAGWGCIGCVTGAVTGYGSAISFCIGWASGG